jgi:hypothetical protein
MDAFAGERQFLDHLAPVWRLLPPQHRGRLFVAAPLHLRALEMGLEAEAIDAEALRRSSLPPKARPGDGPVAFVTSIGDTKIARRLGYRRFVFMEHGAGQAYIGDRDPMTQRHPSYAGGLDRDDVGLFLVPNEYSAGLWRRAYPTARVDVVGCPKLDDLPLRTPGLGPTVAISFHWPGFTCPEADTALGHYLRVLPELAAAFPGRVIGHAHPKADWPARLARHYRRAGIPFVDDFGDVCRQADVYVCDNSSTIFEFAATGRPVVVLNSPRYRREVNHGLRFEPSAGCQLRQGLHFCGAAHVGVQVDRPDELVPGIGRALRDEPIDREARERALESVYPIRQGAGHAAAAAITSWLASTTNQAAA